MAKKTALELSQKGAQRQGLDFARVGVSVGIGALLALAVGCFAQAFSVWREDAANVEVDALRERVVAELGGFIAQRQAGLAKALEDPELRAALATPDVARGSSAPPCGSSSSCPTRCASSSTRPSWTSCWKPTSPRFGYARANILAEARSGGDVARAQAHKDEHGNWLLALGQGARDAGRLLAWAYVTLPPGPVLEVFGGESLAFGRIELRQGAMTGSSLATLGGRATADAEEQQFAVPHSIFAVGTAARRPVQGRVVVPPLDVRSPMAWVSPARAARLPRSALLGWRRRAPRLPAPPACRWRRPGAGRASLAQRLARLAEQGKDAAGSTRAADDAAMPAGARRRRASRPRPRRDAIARGEPVAIDRSIFRAYDIRGVVGKTLTPSVARADRPGGRLADARAGPARDRGRPRRPPVRPGARRPALIDGLRSGRLRRDRHRPGADAGGVLRHLPPATPAPASRSPAATTRRTTTASRSWSAARPWPSDAIQDLYARIAEDRLAERRRAACR